MTFMADAALDRWLIEKGHEGLEITAFNPESGAAKTLQAAELRDLLGLLIEIDRAPPSAESPVGRLRAMGLNPAWHDPPVVPLKPLFSARVGGRTFQGYTLKELLREARRAVEPRNRLIYVVDDDDSAREVQDFILRREGFTIDNFPTGVEAVQAIRNKFPEVPDLVVLDLMLPLKSGVEIIHELQEQEMRAIPVVVVTGRRMDTQLIDEMRLEPNVRAFLSKPFRSQDLTRTAHDILKTRKTGTN